jgi:hypothetical protein
MIILSFFNPRRKDAPMHLIAPEVLTEARGLSPVLSGIGVALGLLLWLCGWRWHRFWVVVAVTLIGGLVGLQAGKSSGGHILAMGVLLALSAGLLALELARVFAFLAAGSAVWMASSAIFPKGQELWVGFLIGGLLGVMLYRFWTMLLTSFLGVILCWHSLFCLLEEFMSFDPAGFASEHARALTGAGLAVTALGVVAQSWLERWYQRRKKRRRLLNEERRREEERERILLGMAETHSADSIWGRLLGRRKKAA